MCFGVKLDKLLLDSHKRVKKDKEKNFKKKQKFFLSRLSRRSQISRHFHQQLFSFEKKKKLKKKREDEKNTEEPQRTTSSLLLEQPQNAHKRDKSDHAFKRRGVEEATKKLVI